MALQLRCLSGWSPRAVGANGQRRATILFVARVERSTSSCCCCCCCYFLFLFILY